MTKTLLRYYGMIRSLCEMYGVTLGIITNGRYNNAATMQKVKKEGRKSKATVAVMAIGEVSMMWKTLVPLDITLPTGF